MPTTNCGRWSLRGATLIALMACADPTSPPVAGSDRAAASAGPTLGQSLVCAPPPTFTVSTTPLALLSGATSGEALGTSGGVNVGVSRFPDGSERVTLWRSATQPVDITPPGVRVVNHLDIDRAGEIVIDGCCNGSFLWSAAHGAARIAPAPTSPFVAFSAVGISNNGSVTGTLQLAQEEHPGVWSRGGTFTDLGVLAGGDAAEAAAINALGQVAGTGNRSHSGVFGLEQHGHAFLYTPGRGMRDLGVPRGTSSAFVTAINQHGELVGYADSARIGLVPWRWTATTGFQRLHPYAAGNHEEDGQARAVNDSGVVAGELTVYGAVSETHAVVWAGTHVQDLGGLLPGDGAAAADLDDRGSVVGRSRDGMSGVDRPVAWKLSLPSRRLRSLDVVESQIQALERFGKLRSSDAETLLAALEPLDRPAGGRLVADHAVAMASARFAQRVMDLAAAGRLSAPAARALLNGATCATLIGPISLP